MSVAAANKRVMMASGRFAMAGRAITCPHCENDVFISGQMPLDRCGIQFAGIPSQGYATAILMCMDCTRVLWFGDMPERVGDGRIEHGQRGLDRVGHRKYVGGLWEQMGKLQFEFMLAQGLKPDHYFLDIACGSLRAGVHLIPYLEPEHYMGLDKEQGLIDAGLAHELPPQVRQAKRPRFVVTDSFEFERFNQAADYALAQSLFTHLPPAYVTMCFTRLRQVIAPDGVFYATYFQTQQQQAHHAQPDDHARFEYTRSEMEAFGTDNGWQTHYIGNWNHPRKQVMVRYTPA